MKGAKSYENFPFWIVLLSTILSLSTYAIGIYVLLGLGIPFAILYIIYILWLEVRLLKGSCIDCYYYGKVCAFGKGKLCALFFKKGNPKRFVARKISMIDILPDFLIFIFPIVGGVILLVANFSWIITALLVILVVLSFGGTAVIRGSFACKYCKQREIGCPAEKLFSKGKTRNRG